MTDHIKLRREDWEKIQTELLELKHQSHHFIYEEMWRIDRVLSIKPVEEPKAENHCDCINYHPDNAKCRCWCHKPLREEDGKS